ncbi:MAG: hypothetical protein QOJ94_414 [Sphingomonadales bacterium]|jgi:hypothetical protein|nr:hypothetical protein [Sphingomonadales bacterium]
MGTGNTVRPEPVEGLAFLFGLAAKQGQAFDNPGSSPGPNGFVSDRDGA